MGGGGRGGIINLTKMSTNFYYDYDYEYECHYCQLFIDLYGIFMYALCSPRESKEKRSELETERL